MNYNYNHFFDHYIGHETSEMIRLISQGHNSDVIRAHSEQFPNEIDHANRHGCTPLMLASVMANLDVIKLLIDLGADLKKKNKDDQSILWVTCFYARTPEHLTAIRFLLDHGADPNEMGGIFDFPLLVSFCQDIRTEFSVDIISLLVSYGANINVKLIEMYNQTPLMSVLSDFYTKLTPQEADIKFKMVEFFLSQKTLDLSARTKIGYNVLMYAATEDSSDPKIVDLILKTGIDINAQKEGGETVLHLAIFQAPLSVIRLLLENKINVNIENKNGCIALELICFHRHNRKEVREIARLLLHYGSHVNHRASNGKTVLDKYVNHFTDYDKELVMIFLEYGAETNFFFQKKKCTFQEYIDRKIQKCQIYHHYDKIISSRNSQKK